jgi:hypothetical protein
VTSRSISTGTVAKAAQKATDIRRALAEAENKARVLRE